MVKNPHCQHACTHVPLAGCTAAVRQEDKDKKDPKQGPGNGSAPGPGVMDPKMVEALVEVFLEVTSLDPQLEEAVEVAVAHPNIRRIPTRVMHPNKWRQPLWEEVHLP